MNLLSQQSGVKQLELYVVSEKISTAHSWEHRLNTDKNRIWRSVGRDCACWPPKEVNLLGNY